MANQPDFEKTLNNLYRQSTQSLTESFIKNVDLKKSMATNFLEPTQPFTQKEHQDLSERFGRLLKAVKKEPQWQQKVLNKIQTSGPYSVDSSFVESVPAVGPITNLKALVERTYHKDKKQTQLMVDQYLELEKIMTNYRRISGDGNCFFRAVNFGYLENLVITEKISELKKITLELYDFFFKKDLQILTKLSKNVREPFEQINILYVIVCMTIVIERLESDEEAKIVEALELLTFFFNEEKSFDIVFT